MSIIRKNLYRRLHELGSVLNVYEYIYILTENCQYFTIVYYKVYNYYNITITKMIS